MGSMRVMIKLRFYGVVDEKYYILYIFDIFNKFDNKLN